MMAAPCESVIPTHCKEEAWSLPPKPTTSSNAALLTQTAISHQNTFGINPIVDAASGLFAIIGKIKLIEESSRLNRLQRKLIQEMHHFQNKLKQQRIEEEFIVLYSYLLCATLDDLISHTHWGKNWQETYNLLHHFHHDAPASLQFFNIVECALNKTSSIELLEYIYLLLNMGYQGKYRTEAQGDWYLSQLMHHLYQQIRSQRGEISKRLTPVFTKPLIKKPAPLSKRNLATVLLLTLSGVMITFISLSYLTDKFADDVYQTLATISTPIAHTL